MTQYQHNGGWTQHMQCILIWRVTLGVSCPWEEGLCTAPQTARNLSPEAPLSVSWWGFTMSCHRFCGLETSLHHRDTSQTQQCYTKITRAQYYWKKMGGHPAANGQNTYMCGTFSSKTGWIIMKWKWYIVQLRIWLPISSPNHYKAVHSGSSDPS